METGRLHELPWKGQRRGMCCLLWPLQKCRLGSEQLGRLQEYSYNTNIPASPLSCGRSALLGCAVCSNMAQNESGASPGGLKDGKCEEAEAFIQWAQCDFLQDESSAERGHSHLPGHEQLFSQGHCLWCLWSLLSIDPVVNGFGSDSTAIFEADLVKLENLRQSLTSSFSSNLKSQISSLYIFTAAAFLEHSMKGQQTVRNHYTLVKSELWVLICKYSPWEDDWAVL